MSPCGATAPKGLPPQGGEWAFDRRGPAGHLRYAHLVRICGGASLLARSLEEEHFK